MLSVLGKIHKVVPDLQEITWVGEMDMLVGNHTMEVRTRAMEA